MAWINVTEAALWDQATFDRIVAHLESIGFQDFADEAKDWRKKGEKGFTERQKQLAAARSLAPEELAEVGIGPHLLEDEPPKTTSETPTK